METKKSPDFQYHAPLWPVTAVTALSWSHRHVCSSTQGGQKKWKLFPKNTHTHTHNLKEWSNAQSLAISTKSRPEATRGIIFITQRLISLEFQECWNNTGIPSGVVAGVQSFIRPHCSPGWEWAICRRCASASACKTCGEVTSSAASTHSDALLKLDRRHNETERRIFEISVCL